MEKNYILVRRGENLWAQCDTSRIEKFEEGKFGYIAKIRDGDEIIERSLTKYEVSQIWNSLNCRQHTQLYRLGYKGGLMKFLAED